MHYTHLGKQYIARYYVSNPNFGELIYAGDFRTRELSGDVARFCCGYPVLIVDVHIIRTDYVLASSCVGKFRACIEIKQYMQ